MTFLEVWLVFVAPGAGLALALVMYYIATHDQYAGKPDHPVK